MGRLARKYSKRMYVFDYLMAAICLPYGLYAMSYWWIATGLIALIVAIINPQKRIRERMIKKSHHLIRQHQ